MKAFTGLVNERPVAVVPWPIHAVLILALALQVAWHGSRPAPATGIEELAPPPDPAYLRVLGFGESAALARLLMLRLQAHDNQPGISIPFRQLDYDRVIEWLDVILALDPASHYPLLSAARVYTSVPDEIKQRKMLEFVHEKFLERPAGRWPWLAHAVYVAEHRIGDLELALEYARAIRKNVPPGAAPDWALQMELFVLDDMGRTESARVLLGALLESGVIRDRNQLEFLKQRLGESEE